MFDLLAALEGESGRVAVDADRGQIVSQATIPIDVARIAWL